MKRLGYALHWLRFKIVNGLRPQSWIGPASTGARWAIRFHRYGFVAFKPGKTWSVSWCFWAQGPCNYATYVVLIEAGR